jgi:SAM-dependent methyltransferase
MSDEWRALNQAFWDERVPIHVAGRFYDVEGFRAGRETLRPFELEEMGDVAGRELVHLQCHFGQDTLSWARHGARVSGLDFSAPGIEAARRLADEMGIAADFVAADVYDAVEALGHRRFDVVYTGLGAINWLPDIERWAGVVAALLRPGGFLYLAEFHPFSAVFADEELTVRHPYFHTEPSGWDAPGTYADLTAKTEHNRTLEWNHGLGTVVTALVAAGLRIEFLREHDYTLFPRWPFLEEHGGDYRLPAGMPNLPLMFSLRASAS